MPKVTIDESICKGCGLCVHICPKAVLVLDAEKLNAKGYNPAVPRFAEKCIGCAMCGMMCPDSAITVTKE
ncbi:MAG: 4Fe-4S binding protein [Provencibacterium sp.]|jgi:2-oxoglutarate ferredoxin oxidoreductase subunit delta|nr:4Fe-4S binding protein [Provencibacterium sp.]